MALTKADMAEHLVQSRGLNKSDARDLVDLFFEEIKSTLEKGESIKLSGFGNFILRWKNERPGRNPKTGKAVPVSARRVVTFKAGQKLKARIGKLEEKAKIMKEPKSLLEAEDVC